MSHVDYLITINVTPSLEDNLVDFLLSLDTAQSFTSFPVSAHDHRNDGLSTTEQVMGKQRKIRFQLYVEKETVAEIITGLKEEFTGSGLEYWVLPIVQRGKI